MPTKRIDGRNVQKITRSTIIKALFVVEPDFLTLHVGVRRVILYYAEQLLKQGWTLVFGSPQGGQIRQGELIIKDEKVFLASNGVTVSESGARSYAMKWSEDLVNPDDFDVNVVTAPWVCALGVPPMPRVVGIVYDLVPNLLAANCLRFPNEIDVFDFAVQHDVGFRYYLANADRVSCISESTKADFLNLYRTAKQLPSVVADIPFECVMAGGATAQATGSVLLVNVLDWRKNLKNIERVLIAASKKASFKLNVVGKERVLRRDADRFFERMEDAGIKVEWHRDVDDRVLARQYSEASVLLFPSLYEGLGLPILEAQEYGVPAITSNISSCPEVNMNPSLCFDPSDIEGMADALHSVLSGNSKALTGQPLRAVLDDYLGRNAQPSRVFTL